MSRARRAAELEKRGTTTRFLVLDLKDDAESHPALRDEFACCKSDEEREHLAIEWFENHPQPIRPRLTHAVVGSGYSRPGACLRFAWLTMPFVADPLSRRNSVSFARE